ncbi:MAG: 4Fe-4S dicluster domain-containing protein [Clostridia bacterium]|nr:4Fe-4S dicluster domain-containing protein [Clostridia bacterium]
MKQIKLDSIQSLFKALSATRTLYLPVDTPAGADFKKYEDGVLWSGALNPNRSAKDFFFPQTENMVDFKVEGKTIEIIEPTRPDEDFVVFGVRACDARSFELLDKVFLCDPVDTYYQNRREHGVIVTVCCNKPAETCFCTNFGIDPTAPGGDVACWQDDDTLYLQANTKAGEALLNSVADVLAEADDSAADSVKETVKAIMAKLPIQNLDLSAFTEDNLLNLFGSEQWKKLSEACLGCGTCTFVCPTCQCYDIKDFDTGHGIKRFRCWDSCMYSEFTRCAHGNPRLSQVERFRQRFMHKLVYFPANNNGDFSCVGCGRCLAKCPISMNIVKVIKALGGANK